MCKKKYLLLISLFLLLLNSFYLMAQDLKLVSFSNIQSKYIGGFKVKYSDKISTTNYSNARMALNKKNNSFFFSSHTYQDAIAEFYIPKLTNTNNPKVMKYAEVNQGFSIIHSRAPTGNNEGLDGIGGMLLHDEKLIVQYYLGYDAAGTASDTTLLVLEPGNLASSKLSGFKKMAGAARVVNYVSTIPENWQATLKGDLLVGNADGMSIVSRLSNGPSLYTLKYIDLLSSKKHIITNKVLNYPINHAMGSHLIKIPPDKKQVSGYGRGWDAFNLSGENKYWTESSGAWFGFIIPNSRTFAVIGYQGMHNSGGGYKVRQDNGNLCGGPCPNRFDDWDTYYWLFDLNDIISTVNIEYTMPYEIGVFDNRFLNNHAGGVTGLPSSGGWDEENKQLYITFANGAGNNRKAAHVIGVYKLDNLLFY
jgi:hypothetical protein